MPGGIPPMGPAQELRGQSLQGEGAGEFKLVICIKRPLLCTTSPLNSTLQQGDNTDLMSSQDTSNAYFKHKYLYLHNVM